MAVNYKFIDGGLIGPTGTTTSDATQQFNLGTLLKAYDSTYGEGELIYTKFTGTVAAGDFVVINRASKLAVQAASGAVATGRGMVGVALAAQASGTYGWVLIRGVHDAANVATGTTTNIPLYLSSTAGRASASVVAGYAASGVVGRIADAASNLGAVELLWPACLGNG